MFQTNTNTSTKIIENASQTKDLVWNSINDIVNSLIGQLPYVIAGIIVLAIFYFISKVIKVIFWSATGRTKLDYRLRVLFGRIVGFGIIILGIFTALTIIVPSFKFSDLIAGLGFTSFVVGFATKDILNNLLSGILILWKQPFQIGDYIFINKFQGKVEHIGVRATRLRADDGEEILIPNGDMYSNALTIRGAAAQRRMILNISLGYETDIDSAKKIIKESMKSTEGVVSEPQPSVYVRDLKSDGISLGIYFWIDTTESKPLDVFDNVASRIKMALSKNNVEIFPPNTVIMQQSDGQDVNSEEDGSDETEQKEDSRSKKDDI